MVGLKYFGKPTILEHRKWLVFYFLESQPFGLYLLHNILTGNAKFSPIYLLRTMSAYVTCFFLGSDLRITILLTFSTECNTLILKILLCIWCIYWRIQRRSNARLAVSCALHTLATPQKVSFEYRDARYS